MNNRLLNKRRLVKNILWNLFGYVMPLLAAVIAIPILIDSMGLSRFGVLTLAWMIVGYFSLFDLGLGRAVTQLIARKLGEENYHEISPLFWTALFLMGGLGGCGAVVLFLISPWMVYDILNIPVKLQEETLIAFYLLAVSIPMVVLSTGVRGVLEAYQYFRQVSLIRTPLGIFNFIGPVLALLYSDSIVPIVGTLVFGRFVALFFYFFLSYKKIKDIHFPIIIKKELLRPLFSFGGWMTVTNIVGPIMVYIDRVIIASLMSIKDVAYYATPHEMVTKLGVIPTALFGVLFPAFTMVLTHDRNKITGYFQKTAIYLLLVLFPVVFFIALFSKEILTLWLGVDYADNSAKVMVVLVLGVFVNSFARLPYTLLQSDGRPDITAKVHLLEFFPYLIGLWLCVHYFGLVGAAIAWGIRITVDMLILYCVVCYKQMVALFVVIKILVVVFVTSLMIASVLFINLSINKFVFYLIVVFLFVLLVWMFVFNDEEKQELVKCIIRKRGSNE